MITIDFARTEAELNEVRRLVRAFVDWMKATYPDSVAAVESYFESLKPELAGLPGDYALPDGRLLVARVGEQIVGTVASRRMSADTCEMKRMFVQTEQHGTGVGKALAQRLIDEARAAGYARMQLETSTGQVGAMGLYRRLGFREIAPYNDYPPQMLAVMRFMSLDLNP